MWAGHGQDVPKTALGKTFGSEWDSFSANSDEARWAHHLGYGNHRRAPVFAWGSFTNNQTLGGGIPLPAPKDLFQMRQAGVYTLEIEMQMLRVNTVSNHLTRHVVRFSPIKILVEKPSAASPGEREKGGK